MKVVFSLLVFLTQFAGAQEVVHVKPAVAVSSPLLKLVNQRTVGTDGVYGKIISPSLTLDTAKPQGERIIASNLAMVSELEAVMNVFTKAPTKNVVNDVYAAVKKYDAEVIGQGGHITFLGSNPSAAQSRILFLIPKNKITTGHPTRTVLDILTSYKRAAKPSDFIFAYDNALNLTAGSIDSYEGSDTSWLLPQAPAPFDVGKNYTLKKCRKLLGWRCITSLYRADAIEGRHDTTEVLFIAIYDLTKNQDHASFNGDKRTSNQITGSTALYIVKENAGWVMIYGTDFQYNNDKTTFQSSIQSEYAHDVDRFKERIAADLGINKGDIK